MRTALVYILLVVINSHVSSQDLDTYRWGNRVLVVSHGQDNLAAQQITAFQSDIFELQDRKLLLIQIKNGQYKIGFSLESSWHDITNELSLIHISEPTRPY